jgi:hypothetical protein
MPNQATAAIARRNRTSASIWTVIGILQILIGLPLLLIGYGVVLIIIGIWNLYVSSTKRKMAQQIESCNHPQTGAAIVNAFDRSLAMTVIFIFINLIFGGVIGVIGNLYDLGTRSEVMRNKLMFGVY